MDKEQDRERIEKMAKVLGEYCVCPRLAAKALMDAGYRKAPKPSKDVPFDGNYHCAYCDKVFRISEQVEFLRHQDNCKASKPSESSVEKVAEKLCWEFDRLTTWTAAAPFTKNRYKNIARSIIKLCQPELTLVEDKYQIRYKYENPDFMGMVEMDAYAKGCADQLDHDRKTLKGE